MVDIFITDLQAYNEGHLVGQWIELPKAEYLLTNVISEVLCEGEYIARSEEHEEYFITDVQWHDVNVFEVNEYENVYELNKRVESLQELEPYQRKAVAFLLTHQLVSDLDEAIQKCDDVIIYENQTMKDVAYEVIEQSYNLDELPQLIVNHINYEGIAKDLELDGSFFEIDSDVYEYAG